MRDVWLGGCSVVGQGSAPCHCERRGVTSGSCGLVYRNMAGVRDKPAWYGMHSQPRVGHLNHADSTDHMCGRWFMFSQQVQAVRDSCTRRAVGCHVREYGHFLN